MGANVNEEVVQVTGEKRKWDRARLIIIDNTYRKSPKLTFKDETIEVTSIDEKHTPLPDITQAMTKPDAVLPCFNPLTGEYLGMDMTDGHLQMLLYSKYLQLKGVKP